MYLEIAPYVLTYAKQNILDIVVMVLPSRVGSGAKREAGAHDCNAGAAPATVSSESLSA